MGDITIYTDGSAVDYSAGIGFVIIYASKEVEQYAAKIDYYPATNQQAELLAIRTAIETVSAQPRDIQGPLLIRTDSQYAIGCLTLWYPNWERNGWKNAKRQPVENQDIIKSTLDIIRRYPYPIRFEHVKAHSGDYYNELADQLANAGRQM